MNPERPFPYRAISASSGAVRGRNHPAFRPAFQGPVASGNWNDGAPNSAKESHTGLPFNLLCIAHPVGGHVLRGVAAKRAAFRDFMP